MTAARGELPCSQVQRSKQYFLQPEVVQLEVRVQVELVLSTGDDADRLVRQLPHGTYLALRHHESLTVVKHDRAEEQPEPLSSQRPRETTRDDIDVVRRQKLLERRRFH